MSHTPEARKSLENRASTKKAYARPKLVEYGSLAKLTQNKSGALQDSKTGMNSKLKL